MIKKINEDYNDTESFIEDFENNVNIIASNLKTSTLKLNKERSFEGDEYEPSRLGKYSSNYSIDGYIKFETTVDKDLFESFMMENNFEALEDLEQNFDEFFAESFAVTIDAQDFIAKLIDNNLDPRSTISITMEDLGEQVLFKCRYTIELE